MGQSLFFPVLLVFLSRLPSSSSFSSSLAPLSLFLSSRCLPPCRNAEFVRARERAGERKTMHGTSSLLQRIPRFRLHFPKQSVTRGFLDLLSSRWFQQCEMRRETVVRKRTRSENERVSIGKFGSENRGFPDASLLLRNEYFPLRRDSRLFARHACLSAR